MTNDVLTPMPEFLAEELYRIPIRRSDRPHIGAFVAGALMREVGGDVYIDENRAGKLGTVIEIPMEEGDNG